MSQLPSKRRESRGICRGSSLLVPGCGFDCVCDLVFWPEQTWGMASGHDLEWGLIGSWHVLAYGLIWILCLNRRGAWQ